MNGNSLTTPPSGNRLNRVLLSSRGLLLGAILLIALLCFESFNFSTTQIALRDLLGELNFAGVSWATILAIAFCSIDFAGIARLFIPEERTYEVSKDTWYLFGAWLLAATMNALLTWWGVSLGLINRSLQSTAILSQEKLLDIVPVLIALLVWFTRILLIGSFSIAGPRLFSTAESLNNIPPMARAPQRHSVERPAPVSPRPSPQPSMVRPRPAAPPRPTRPEPEYVPDPAYAALEPAPHSLGGNPLGEQSGKGGARF